MAANSGASSKTAEDESKRHKLQRSITLERKDDERIRIHDLAVEVCQWLSQILEVEITPENYLDKLDTGVELCKLQNKLVAGGEDPKISYNAKAKKHSIPGQENITHFIKWCKGFIHSDEVFESNDLVDHKHELKSQMRVLSCLDKVRRKYSSVPEKIEEVTETQVTDIPNQNDPSDLPQEPKDNSKEKEQVVASNIQQSASDIDGESQPSNKPEEEESEEKDEETTDNPAPELRSRPSARNEHSQGEPSQQEDKNASDDHFPSCNKSYMIYSYFYPLLFLCLILLFLGGLYFLSK